ncbi:hypothetical protein [Anthocerotibacter panamensis]|uniref:hypothetical protein n=1 Tax=Anthocerotibacter panamensis TaxID=2857077 RepID=UPI001C405809|nr:hypothetical protein [Anthocerotibacter panamensis]
MQDLILTVIAEAATDLCWAEYQKEQRIPNVSNLIYELLESCGLKAVTTETMDKLVYRTSQYFQNRLLQNRMARSIENG